MRECILVGPRQETGRRLRLVWVFEKRGRGVVNEGIYICDRGKDCGKVRRMDYNRRKDRGPARTGKGAASGLVLKERIQQDPRPVTVEHTDGQCRWMLGEDFCHSEPGSGKPTMHVQTLVHLQRVRQESWALGDEELRRVGPCMWHTNVQLQIAQVAFLAWTYW